MVTFIVMHRINGDLVCLNKEYIEAIEQERDRTDIKCSGIHYFVKETVEEILIQVDQLVEPRQQIRRVVEGEIKPAVPYEYKELKEKKPRKKKQPLGELGYESK